MRKYRISQLADRTGVPTTTLRFYETVGLLPAERTTSGYRTYDDDAVERVAFIRTAKHLGLALEQIQDLMSVREAGACRDAREHLRSVLADRIRRAQSEADALSDTLTMLRTVLDRVDTVPDRTSACDPDCDVLDDLSLSERAEAGGPAEQPGEADRADADRADAAAGSEGAGREEIPVACSLTGTEQGEREAQWHALLEDARREAIPGGLRLSVPGDRVVEVARLAAAEQRCCPFFDFDLSLRRDRLLLEVRAPSEAGGLVSAMFGEAAG
ncbi:MerR family transcriptional regulator [Saccharomonospora saliphila]|uniref:MerR family transcriptional regulator n=1 Tax=Saccharomonospora saliphila TaxID=369829 RepID=UPI0003710C7F|nr:MerR family transcriptional regulator [Saccharomonospora saliphila]